MGCTVCGAVAAVNFSRGLRVGGAHGAGTVAVPDNLALRVPHAVTDVFVSWDSGVKTWSAPADLRCGA